MCYNAVSTPLILRLMSACCPLVVRLLFDYKTDNKRTTMGQQADNNGTIVGVRAALKRRWKVESGKGKVESGKWKVESGKGKAKREKGKGKMEKGKAKREK